jgi:HlyD family secretion protein
MKKFNPLLIVLIALITYSACKTEAKKFDASGTFEADEIIVSAEATGKILELNITEGDTLTKGKIIGKIDPLSIELQKEQVEASMTALTQKSNDAGPQISVLQEQIQAQRNQINVLRQQQTILEREQMRFDKLVKAEAATPKQLDDITGQLDILKRQIQAAEGQISVLEKQISAQSVMVSIQNRAILSEKLPLEKRRQQMADMVSKTQIITPMGGTVLSKYANKGEMTAAGKALFKVADLSTLTLRAYVTGDQLAQIKINQKVKISIDNGKDTYKDTEGVITWISDKAEFTPKTIQTKEERANLVYATKIKVKNDGYLKIGMYGEVTF